MHRIKLKSAFDLTDTFRKHRKFCGIQHQDYGRVLWPISAPGIREIKARLPPRMQYRYRCYIETTAVKTELWFHGFPMLKAVKKTRLSLGAKSVSSRTILNTSPRHFWCPDLDGCTQQALVELVERSLLPQCSPLLRVGRAHGPWYHRGEYRPRDGLEHAAQWRRRQPITSEPSLPDIPTPTGYAVCTGWMDIYRSRLSTYPASKAG